MEDKFDAKVGFYPSGLGRVYMDVVFDRKHVLDTALSKGDRFDLLDINSESLILKRNPDGKHCVAFGGHAKDLHKRPFRIRLYFNKEQVSSKIVRGMFNWFGAEGFGLSPASAYFVDGVLHVDMPLQNKRVRVLKRNPRKAKKGSRKTIGRKTVGARNNAADLSETSSTRRRTKALRESKSSNAVSGGPVVNKDDITQKEILEAVSDLLDSGKYNVAKVLVSSVLRD